MPNEPKKISEMSNVELAEAIKESVEDERNLTSTSPELLCDLAEEAAHRLFKVEVK